MTNEIKKPFSLRAIYFTFLIISFAFPCWSEGKAMVGHVLLERLAGDISTPGL
jgi:hypothetical protein